MTAHEEWQVHKNINILDLHLKHLLSLKPTWYDMQVTDINRQWQKITGCWFWWSTVTCSSTRLSSQLVLTFHVNSSLNLTIFVLHKVTVVHVYICTSCAPISSRGCLIQFICCHFQPCSEVNRKVLSLHLITAVDWQSFNSADTWFHGRCAVTENMHSPI